MDLSGHGMYRAACRVTDADQSVTHVLTPTCYPCPDVAPIHREIAAGRLQHIRPGRVIRIPRAVLVLPRKSA